MSFRNRSEAGRRLAEALASYANHPVVVLALPRGGVPVVAEIAQALRAPLDLVLVRKIGSPFHEELAMGAVADGGQPVTVRNEDVISMLGVDAETFAKVRDQQLAEIERRRAAYLRGCRAADVKGRVAIVESVAVPALRRRRTELLRHLAHQSAIESRKLLGSPGRSAAEDEIGGMLFIGGMAELITAWLDGTLAASTEEIVEAASRALLGIYR